MCGIVGAIANRDIVPVLVEGLRRLEYRGYDSAGVAVLNGTGHLKRVRTVGKVQMLQDAIDASPTHGELGVAHTRWATHGVPSERNAHPHISRDGLAIVHNGIIENHEELREELRAAGYEFTSDTDTEVIAHRIHHHLKSTDDLFKAVRATVAELEGAYALAVVSETDRERIILAREGCPVVIGFGEGENFVASDVAALLPVTRRFMFLEEGDVAEVHRTSVRVLDREGTAVERPVRQSELSADAADKGPYDHFMLKEIHEQPRAIADTLQERVANGRLLEAAFGPAATEVLKRTEHVHIVACGTSFHAGSVARYLIEQIAKIPCSVEIASEYRYRNPVVPKNSLFVTISQSGETADTLAALRLAKQAGYLSSLAICNVPESSLVRESELVMLTRAGPEIGVASTKAFTAQLAVLTMIAFKIAQLRNSISAERLSALLHELEAVPSKVEKILANTDSIKEVAKRYAQARDFLYLGRGYNFPVALEGALKLKEISYIHAEGYPAAEMKHGPIALVDDQLPVVVVATKDSYHEKVLSNMQEIKARKGRVIGVVTETDEAATQLCEAVLTVPEADEMLAPMLNVIPLQLLAYYIGTEKGCDVDKPRNLAKSVTVE